MDEGKRTAFSFVFCVPQVHRYGTQQQKNSYERKEEKRTSCHEFDDEFHVSLTLGGAEYVQPLKSAKTKNGCRVNLNASIGEYYSPSLHLWRGFTAGPSRHSPPSVPLQKCLR